MSDEIFRQVVSFPVMISVSILFLLLSAWRTFPYATSAIRPRNGRHLPPPNCQKARIQASFFFGLSIVAGFMAALASSNEIEVTPCSFVSFLFVFSICPGLPFFALGYLLLRRMCEWIY